MAMNHIYIAFVTAITTCSLARISAMKEVCQWETFEAKCLEDEVIIIKEARYGRMGVGRCQPTDFGYAGCSADVSAIMHSRCSGRKYCSVQVPDAEMFAATPCPKDLVTYLQADYECIKVAKHTTDNCDDQILTAVSGDIAKPLPTTNSYVCPQRILAQPGQTVNVYLNDFYNKDSNIETQRECINYGYMSEDGNTPMKICGGEIRKSHLIYSSDSNVVDIMLTDASSHSHHYVLHYEIIGCPTIKAPKNAWVKIQDNTAVVMCNFSHIASELVCSGNKWVGEVQNCTSFDARLLKADSLSITAFDNSLTSVAIVLCAGIASGLVFIFGLLALIKAYRSKSKPFSELPQFDNSIHDKPELAHNDNSFKHIDEYKPVYVPVGVPVHQGNLPRALQSNTSTILYPTHPTSKQFTKTLAVRIPVTQNTYGPLRPKSSSALEACPCSVYEISKSGKLRPRDLILTMEGTALN